MMRLSSSRLIRNASRIALRNHARPVVAACSMNNHETTPFQKRNLHLPPLHKRFILHNRPHRLLHDSSPPPPTEELPSMELFESDVDYNDEVTEQRRTFKVMSAGVHHTTDTTRSELDSTWTWYDEDYDRDHLHMTTAHSRVDHELTAESDLLQHDDVLTVQETRRQWDSDHYYNKTENDPLTQYEDYPFNDFDASGSEEEDYEYEMEEDWEIGRQEVEAIMEDPNDPGFVPELEDL